MVKEAKAAHLLSFIIVALSLVASLTGILWQGENNPYPFTSLRGETVMIQGSGLYKYDSVSIAAQARAQDTITLVLGIPMLLISIFLSIKKSVRGRLLLTGILGYFFYTYASYSFLTAYNQLFLLYTTLFSASLFAFIIAFKSIDVQRIKSLFSARTPRRITAGFELFTGVAILMMWLGRIVPALPDNSTPVGLESYSTLIIQALDLGIVLPLAILAGLLLWRKDPWGYVLSAVFLIKAVTLLIAILAMVVNMILAGVAVSMMEIFIFSFITLAAIIITWWYLKSVPSF